MASEIMLSITCQTIIKNNLKTNPKPKMEALKTDRIIYRHAAN